VVQGFLHQIFREQGCLISVNRAIFEEGTSFTLGLVLQLETSCYCIRFICFMYLLYSTFYSPHIYTSIPNWFPPRRGGGGGGVLSRVMLTKNTCVHFMHS
jgi:hypothetical protein